MAVAVRDGELHSAASSGRSSAKRSLGQYFTPPAVAAFALRAVRELAGASLPRFPRLIDPACGEGVFLLEALAWEPRLSEKGALVGLDVDTAVRQRWRESDLERRATL